MFSRRSFLQFLPLSLFLGPLFRSREAIASQSPSQVAVQLFDQVRSRPLAEFLTNAAPAVLKQQRQAFDRLVNIWVRDGRGAELFKQLGISEDELASGSDLEVVQACFRSLQVRLEELRETMHNATLTPVGEVKESERRVHVAYRLEAPDSIGSIRPSILQLVYEPGGWKAGFSEPPMAIHTAALSARELPRLRLAVVGEFREDKMVHFVCRSEARFSSGDVVAPVFCCTFGHRTDEASEMRSHDCAPLKQRLRKLILDGISDLLAEADPGTSPGK